MLEKKIKLAEMDSELVADEIGEFIINRVKNVGSTGCVIGLSGGVDSTTTAALIARAFDSYNAHNPARPLELVGYILPSSVNNPADAEDGIKVAERLGIRYEVQSIDSIVDAYKNTNPEAFENKTDKGNMMSRIRANILNTKSATEKKTLAGTGNKDEDFGIGYYTLFGDGAVHMSPIAGLSKRLVRQMTSYLGFDDLATREPTAGLEPGQTDFKDLGYSYDTVELITGGIEQGFTPEQLVQHGQVVPLVEKEITQYARTFGRFKFNSVKDVVYDVVKNHGRAEGKATIVHPPVARVTLKYD